LCHQPCGDNVFAACTELRRNARDAIAQTADDGIRILFDVPAVTAPHLTSGTRLRQAATMGIEDHGTTGMAALIEGEVQGVTGMLFSARHDRRGDETVGRAV
jgi:hypothetical protein